MATEGPTCMGPGPGPGPLRIRASIKQAGLGSTGTIPSRGPGPLALGEPRSHSVPQARVTVPTEWPSLTVWILCVHAHSAVNCYKPVQADRCLCKCQKQLSGVASTPGARVLRIRRWQCPLPLSNRAFTVLPRLACEALYLGRSVAKLGFRCAIAVQHAPDAGARCH
jgi:hypothetical protein